MIGGEWKRAGGDRHAPLLVFGSGCIALPLGYIGTQIVSFYSVLGPVSDALVRSFFVERVFS
jgi:hypothetical protein